MRTSSTLDKNGDGIEYVNFSIWDTNESVKSMRGLNGHPFTVPLEAMVLVIAGFTKTEHFVGHRVAMQSSQENM